MEENKKKQKRKQIVEFILLFFLSGLIAGTGSYFYGRETRETICNVVMIMLGTGIVMFALVSSEVNELYYYPNKGNYGKFVLFYLAALAGSLLFPQLPVAGWPFLVVFVVLSLFSNSISGLISGSVCLMLTVMLENEGSYREFFLFFFSGLVGIMVFSRLNAAFKVGVPIFISLLCLTISLSANIVLFEEERLSLSQFIIAAINLMVSFILLLIILKIFSNTVIHKYRDKYMELNDTECPLLVQLKEMSKDEYYHAVHTAYLGDKIAKRLDLNDAAVKACGYYNRIGLLRGENSWENVEAICEEYHFPPDAKKLLKEYLDSSQKMISKETIVILFSDCIVSFILYCYKKDPKTELDYKQVIDTVFRDKMESGEISDSEITMAQLQEMKKIFIEEKLYYDFLR